MAWALSSRADDHMSYRRADFHQLSVFEREQFIALTNDLNAMAPTERERFVRLAKRIVAKPDGMVLSLAQVKTMLDMDSDLPFH
jgi:hypothetical protein